MGKLFKWIGIVLGGLIGLVVLAVVVLLVLGSMRVSKSYDVAQETITVPDDTESVARGQVLANVSGCTGCHTANLGGEIFIEDAALAVIGAPNLTTGPGGVGGQYTDADWERAIRHGIRPDGTGLIIMPVQYFNHYSDADLGALIAYLKSVPPVDHTLPQRAIGPMGRGLIALGAFPLVPDLIDHTTSHLASSPAGATVEHGQYLVNIAACQECHGEGLVGRPAEAAEEGPPAGPNLTPSGELQAWSEADFATTLRTGVTPEGESLDPELMPWPHYTFLSDEEISAIYQYLKSLPPAPTQ